jgi:hypothetical protein
LRQSPEPNRTRLLRRPGFLRFDALGARLHGDHARWGIGIIAVLFLLLGIVPLALSGAGLLSASPVPTAIVSPTVAAATSQVEATVPVAVATPEGTPAPKPSEAVDTAASASVTPPSRPPAATATPSPQPGLWRVEGYVVDESGNPLKNVCVVVGPHGCQKFSPHTDEQGHYFLDVAAATTVNTSFDFYFETPGRETVWWHFTPTGPIEFNVVLKPS